ncbi:hypothetical protein GCM10027047_28960 [Rhodococcus aerolatus]
MRRCEHDARCSRVRVAREPVTAFEAILCVCFADALGVCRVGADDDFFALGGDRAAAAGVVARVQRQVGVPLELSWVHELRTPERLAKRARRALDLRLAAG